MTYSKEKSRYTFLTNVPRTRTVEDQNVEHVMIQYCVLGWSDFFLVWQKTALNQRSGMILEVQIQIFSTCTAKFSFKKIPVGLNINIFLWKSAWSFLLQKRTNA